MKISELIEKLNEVMKENGDLTVSHYLNDNGHSEPISGMKTCWVVQSDGLFGRKVYTPFDSEDEANEFADELQGSAGEGITICKHLVTEHRE